MLLRIGLPATARRADGLGSLPLGAGPLRLGTRIDAKRELATTDPDEQEPASSPVAHHAALHREARQFGMVFGDQASRELQVLRFVSG